MRFIPAQVKHGSPKNHGRVPRFSGAIAWRAVDTPPWAGEVGREAERCGSQQTDSQHKTRKPRHPDFRLCNGASFLVGPTGIEPMTFTV